MKKSVQSRRYKRFTALLAKARQEAGMTQQQIADALDKPQSFVAKYENGERRLDLIEFLEIARVLNVDPKSIIDALR